MSVPENPPRFLDREPRKGDRVHIEFDAEVTGVPSDDKVWISGLTVPREVVRVIAPEPAVGDVVTEDMDLPEGSIIEWDHAWNFEGIGSQVARLSDGVWVQDPEARGALRPFSAAKETPWRIVRIGAAS